MHAAERASPVYPDSDGQPMADNTLQYQWIVTLAGNLDRLLPDDFVAGDLLWYPVEGRPDIRRAPDVLVALGRPKGHRGSYLQWVEDGHAPDVVIEVMSPSNTIPEMLRKMDFYQRHGVAEFVLVDPDREVFQVWARSDGLLAEIEHDGTWSSARVPLRLTVDDAGHLAATTPDGEPYRSFAELAAWADALEARVAEAAARAEREADRAEREADRAEREADRAAKEAERAARLAARLRALGEDPDAL